MNTQLTTATANTDTGRLLRSLLAHLAEIHQPTYEAGHSTAEIESDEQATWEAIADAATATRKNR